MEFLVENWAIIVFVICSLVGFGISIYKFTQKPSSEQMESVKEWLLFAVTEAEKKLGGGTGQIKLRLVYDMFIEKFPYTSSIISFNTFSVLVDEALEKMKTILESNKAVESYVKGE